MHIFDLFRREDYILMLNQKYIRENHHPYLDLKIIGYTEKAQFDNEWNDVTRQCRGLIVNSEGTVIARPFDKFLNYGQRDTDKLLMDYRVIATDKMDGSLGIVWKYKDEIGVATRGSFTSDQAVHATAILKEKYSNYAFIHHTTLVEIVYPENRIVLDYQGMDDLVLLGIRHISDGSVLSPDEVIGWRGPKTPTLPYKTLREAVEAPQRPNAEGLVLYFPDLDYRIKLKQADYIALHRVVTGLTKRRIWESMKEGKSLEELCEIVPDEWHEWLRNTYRDIYSDFHMTHVNITTDYWLVRMDLDNEYPEGWTRKNFAARVKGMQYQGFMFNLLDGKDIVDKLYDLIKPDIE